MFTILYMMESCICQGVINPGSWRILYWHFSRYYIILLRDSFKLNCFKTLYKRLYGILHFSLCLSKFHWKKRNNNNKRYSLLALFLNKFKWVLSLPQLYTDSYKGVREDSGQVLSYFYATKELREAY